MLVEFSMVPLGTEAAGLGKYVAGLMDILDQSGLAYQLGPMGTVVEGDWDEVMSVIRDCQERMRAHTGRVVTRILIDDREGATGRITGKVESVLRHRPHP